MTRCFTDIPCTVAGWSGMLRTSWRGSRWLAELMKINSVHSQYNPDWWKQYRHYLLAFHDETFECIARGHSLKQTMSSFLEALHSCQEPPGVTPPRNKLLKQRPHVSRWA